MARKGAVLAAVVAGAVAVLGACGGNAASDDPTPAGRPPAPGTVILRDIEFKPGKISVKAGDTVTWRFEDGGIPHDVVADDKSFKSEVKDSGNFRHTFDEPGTYDYKCTLHPVQMTGTITVR